MMSTLQSLPYILREMNHQPLSMSDAFLYQWKVNGEPLQLIHSQEMFVALLGNALDVLNNSADNSVDSCCYFRCLLQTPSWWLKFHYSLCSQRVFSVSLSPVWRVFVSGADESGDNVILGLIRSLWMTPVGMFAFCCFDQNEVTI